MPPAKSSRYSTSQQKACQPCSSAKAKCDRKPGTCGRCALRGLTCNYVVTESSRGVQDTSLFDETEYSIPTPDVTVGTLQVLLPRDETPSSTVPSVENIGNTPNSSSSTAFQTQALPLGDITAKAYKNDTEDLDFSGLELVCPINSDDIRNRWLNSYVPFPGQAVKEYTPSVMSFVYRVLKSYASMMVRGRGIPSFIHSSQITTTSITPPLSTCLSLVRIYEQSLPGSERVATDVIQREMNNLYESHESYDDINLLAAFQAYLVYSMVLFFHLNSRGPATFLRQAIINLQEIACASSRRGLVCLSEQQGIRPKWEAWTVAEARRRTLFTMYFFDNVLSAQDGLSIYLGVELQGLPAPSSKSLWQSSVRHDWERTYNIHLAEWADRPFRIDELWPIPQDLGEDDIIERRDRVDRWLEAVDEYGTMLYAVTSCTHGG
ncbi:C6 finger domain [Fusarium albosuccineum]|uniref:C6 finger domain n=1 Tax=Fusarium albosuccineum TaxID=1237068 RepID=A0A8H4LPN3_9HYPO|nr:C6 finger domain [Fusarium albosuccineum]